METIGSVLDLRHRGLVLREKVCVVVSFTRSGKERGDANLNAGWELSELIKQYCKPSVPAKLEILDYPSVGSVPLGYAPPITRFAVFFHCRIQALPLIAFNATKTTLSGFPASFSVKCKQQGKYSLSDAEVDIRHFFHIESGCIETCLKERRVEQGVAADTLFLQGLPTRYFTEAKDSTYPSSDVILMVFSSIAPVKRVEWISEPNTLNTKLPGITFSCFIQFRSYVEACHAFKILCDSTLTRKSVEGALPSVLASHFTTEFDFSAYLSAKAIRERKFKKEQEKLNKLKEEKRRVKKEEELRKMREREEKKRQAEEEERKKRKEKEAQKKLEEEEKKRKQEEERLKKEEAERKRLEEIERQKELARQARVKAEEEAREREKAEVLAAQEELKRVRARRKAEERMQKLKKYKEEAQWWVDRDKNAAESQERGYLRSILNHDYLEEEEEEDAEEEEGSAGEEKTEVHIFDQVTLEVSTLLSDENDVTTFESEAVGRWEEGSDKLAWLVGLDGVARCEAVEEEEEKIRSRRIKNKQLQKKIHEEAKSVELLKLEREVSEKRLKEALTRPKKPIRLSPEPVKVERRLISRLGFPSVASSAAIKNTNVRPTPQTAKAPQRPQKSVKSKPSPTPTTQLPHPKSTVAPKLSPPKTQEKPMTFPSNSSPPLTAMKEEKEARAEAAELVKKKTIQTRTAVKFNPNATVKSSNEVKKQILVSRERQAEVNVLKAKIKLAEMEKSARLLRAKMLKDKMKNNLK